MQRKSLELLLAGNVGDTNDFAVPRNDSQQPDRPRIASDSIRDFLRDAYENPGMKWLGGVGTDAESDIVRMCQLARLKPDHVKDCRDIGPW